jgi:hypothetical protein
MASRIINSPGVQINEIDETAIQSNIFGTDVLITGFASKGPTDEIISVSSISEFEQIFGTPTNAAERYFYYSVKPLIGTGANLLLSRLPYGASNGDGFGSQYSAIVYPVVAVSGRSTDIVDSTATAVAFLTGGVNISTGQLSSVSVVLSGLYYTTTPAVAVSAPQNPGTIATLSANITLAGTVSSLTITNAGSGYTAPPTITIAAPTGVGGVVSTLNGASVSTYVLGKPSHFTLTKSQYLSCINGEAFAWSNITTTSAGSALNITSIRDFGRAGVVVFNKAQTTINDKYEGYYIGVIDNTNANPATQFDGIASATTVNTAALTAGNKDATTPVPATRLNFALSGSNASNGTLSQVFENAASFDISTNQFNDYLTLGVVKLRQSIFSPDTVKLDYIVEEKFAASLDFYRQRTPENGGPITSAYIGSEINDSSRNITIMVNDFVSNRNSSTWIGSNGLPTKSIRCLSRSLENLLTNTSTYSQVSGTIGITPAAFTSAKNALIGGFGYADDLLALGAYVNPAPTDKIIGSLPNKVDRILQLLENDELYDIDISVEAGLGTIYATTCAAATSYYDDTLMNPRLQQAIGFLQTTLNYTAPADDTLDLRGNYNTIFSKFTDFARDRMDHIFIADPIRHILVQGNNTKILSDNTKSWSQHVFSPLRHQFELANTSYAAAYANWARVNDGFSQTNVWVPFSGTVASDFARSDRDFAYWAAPAGFRRGLVSEVDDIAIAPNQKQRDDLYKFNLNPITQFVREGIVIYGQKTLNRMPSAFDRVNVRRLFILLEKQTKAIARFYVFEPNTLYTRTRIVDDLTPNFEAAKTATINQGIYDYIIVCDDRNNPPSVIDANELVVDIYIKPVRTAEFILVNFHATRTSANFQEILR